MDDATRDSLASQYKSAKPYPHCVIPDICVPETLAAVREEIISSVHATYKETDLFNMFQTGDLANLDGLDEESAAALRTVRALRDTLYSADFRAYISSITGCGELSDRTDCACNVHARGGHLLCHDDVIGTRAVSFIIYLTSPEQTWTAELGGALELYPEHPDLKSQPAVFPTASVLPVWNTMAMFAVQPGGWFHKAVPPSGAESATLRQLQLQTGAGADAFRPFASLGAEPGAAGREGEEQGLRVTDLAVLRAFVNPVYLQPATWSKILARFAEEGSVQLQSFLRNDWAERAVAACAAADAADGLDKGQAPKPYATGVGGGWTALGPAFKQRYLRYSGVEGEEEGCAGAVLDSLRAGLLAHPAFQHLVRKLTDVGLAGWRGEVRRFRPGMDYTVAHHGVLQAAPCMDAVICFLGADPGAAEAWEGGEAGGYEAYMLADEAGDGEASGAAAEVYRSPAEGGEESESGVLNISPSTNCLSLVLRDDETELLKFVKYVSAAAPGSRWDVSMEYSLEDEDQEEDA